MNRKLNKRLSLMLLSDYRSQIMGLAAVFIILCHSTLKFHGFASDFYRIYINQLMQCGVDIFLLVSGLGCYFSFAKNPSIKLFYKKRLFRIFVPFVFFLLFDCAISCLFQHVYFWDYVWQHSIISFFVSGCLKIWFIAAILVLYLVFPIIYRMINWKTTSVLIVAGVITAIVLLPFWKSFPSPLPVIREIFFTRIPVFLVGVWVGKKLFKRIPLRINGAVAGAILIVSIILLSVNAFFNSFDTWTYSRILFLPLSCMFCLVISNFFKRINLEKKPINKIMCFFGMLSLELYLVFEQVLALVTVYLPQPQVVFSRLSDTTISIIINVVAVIITIFASLAIHKVSHRLQQIMVK